MSVALHHDVWIRGKETVAHYGPVSVVVEDEDGEGLERALAEMQRLAKSLGATDVTSLAIDAVIGEGEGRPQWRVVGAAVKLEWARWG